MNNTDFEYMKEALAVDLAEMLAKDYDLSVDDALNTLYNSDTYTKISAQETGLYFQSSIRYYPTYIQTRLSNIKRESRFVS
jgi:hypothetical protein